MGIYFGNLLTIYGAVLGHLYIKDGTVFVDSLQSLGLDIGIIRAVIGIISLIFGMKIKRFRY